MRPTTRSARARRRFETSVQRDGGFTLVEAMVALVVFAVGMLAMAALIPFGTRGATKAGQDTGASAVAAATMERLLDTPYALEDLDAGTHTDDQNPYPGNYYVTWVVVANSPDTLCKRITVTVRWPTATSSTKCQLVAITPESNG